jgi:hypothetical protein
MKITNEERKNIADSQRIHSIISDKLKKNSEGTRVDLANLAKSLTKRRDRVLMEEEEEEKK